MPSEPKWFNTPTADEIEAHFAWIDDLYADEEPVVIGPDGRVIPAPEESP